MGSWAVTRPFNRSGRVGSSERPGNGVGVEAGFCEGGEVRQEWERPRGGRSGFGHTHIAGPRGSECIAHNLRGEADMGCVAVIRAQGEHEVARLGAAPVRMKRTRGRGEGGRGGSRQAAVVVPTSLSRLDPCTTIQQRKRRCSALHRRCVPERRVRRAGGLEARPGACVRGEQ